MANDQFTKEEINKRDVAGFFAHKVQETGENNGWYLSKPPPIKTDEEAIDCYMKGALYQWFEGGKDSGRFGCGDSLECGEFCPKVDYCDPQLGNYDLACSSRKVLIVKSLTATGLTKHLIPRSVSY